MSRHLRKFVRISSRKRNLVTVDEVVQLVTKAYNQGYWDGCHSNDPRTSVATRPQGLKRHLERSAEWLRSRATGRQFT